MADGTNGSAAIHSPSSKNISVRVCVCTSRWRKVTSIPLLLSPILCVWRDILFTRVCLLPSSTSSSLLVTHNKRFMDACLSVSCHCSCSCSSCSSCCCCYSCILLSVSSYTCLSRSLSTYSVPLLCAICEVKNTNSSLSSAASSRYFVIAMWM